MQKIAILGYGGRGKNYANILRMEFRSKAKIVAVIDNIAAKREVAKKELHLSDDMIFSSLDEFLKKEKCADWLLICTQDCDHYEHAMKAMDAGYDLLLEKPISGDIKQCLEIEEKSKQKGIKIAVCHVLRYTTFFNKVKQILDSGVLGDIISIEMEESVGYWHQAHSYVRGDWRRTEDSTPMILAKCCHDLDMAVYLAQSKCKTVSSIGKLHHFRKECAPDGCAERCVDCKITDCPYDARKLYIEKFKKLPFFLRKSAWPMNRLVPDAIPSVPKLEKALREGQFGKCVYHSDNDAVDFQVVQMLFENGINCTLTMTAFSQNPYRTIIVRGTKGHLQGKFESFKLDLNIYGKRKKAVRAKLDLRSHGGGDTGLIASLMGGTMKTDISESIESHIIAYAAEKSRTENGKMIDVQDLKNSITQN